ncbi:ribonuclease HII [Pseudolysinimonas sp.]|uniref:ribonuclease HII n=1 Tax=Pseudolysinimonas sp. TaxID=2680009 RepID=UPI00286CD0CF|nr:ribonuclease HII [Pseudolysinimonas sp.]
MVSSVPTLRHERILLREGARLVIGMDEVGRGALAGPVAVGLSIVDVDTRTAPEGLKDSKLLAEAKREELQPKVARWARHAAVGLASNERIEQIGIIAALGLAARRAIDAIREEGVDLTGAVVLLDGSHDWLTPAINGAIPVTMKVKADRTCAAVAAASVLAKVHRDRLMIDSDAVHPGYLWTSNKGYASAEHYAGIERVGASPLHRWSWLKQPGLFDLDALGA